MGSIPVSFPLDFCLINVFGATFAVALHSKGPKFENTTNSTDISFLQLIVRKYFFLIFLVPNEMILLRVQILSWSTKKNYKEATVWIVSQWVIKLLWQLLVNSERIQKIWDHQFFKFNKVESK